jgi:hypothetical protein
VKKISNLELKDFMLGFLLGISLSMGLYIYGVA